MAGPITHDYISATRKSFVSNDNDGKMIKKNFIEIEGTFLVKIRDNAFNGKDGENVFEHINSFLKVVKPLKIRGLSHDQFRLSVFPISLSEEDAKDDNDPNEIDDVPEIFKIEEDMFNFDTPLCIAFEEFNYLLKIDPDLFTYDVQEIKTYDEYEQKLNNKTQGLDEQWPINRVPYELCEHICEPYRFKNGITKWPTCSSDTDRYCNRGELTRMVRVGSWGVVTLDVMKFCAWLKNSFENFHELDYDVLVKLEECWWKVNTNEVCPFTRWDNRLRGPYAKAKSKRTFDPYLNIDRKPEWNYETNNGGNIQDGQRCMDNLTHEPSACKIRRFKMAKYTFEADEEYIAIKELEHINHSEINMGTRYACQEFFHKMDDR
ncbi:hypothetical protein Tco_0185107 [Tanacetum coccineum]